MTETVEDVAETEEIMSKGNGRGTEDLEGRLNSITGYVLKSSIDGDQATGDYKENKPQNEGIKVDRGQTASKNSPLISRLEEKVSKSAIRAKGFGVDETEYLSFELAQEPTFYSEKEESKEGKDTINGVLAFIYHHNKETGELEGLFEQVRPDYEQEVDRGKVKLYGGTLKTTDKSSIDGFIREIEEEFEEPAASIIIEALINNGRSHTREHYIANGQFGYTDFLVVEIEPKNKWKMVKNARTKHDAGMSRVLTGAITRELHDDYFAFGYGPLIKELTKQEIGPKNPPHYIEFKPVIEFKPFIYKDSFIPINYFIF